MIIYQKIAKFGKLFRLFNNDEHKTCDILTQFDAIELIG